MNIKQLNQHLNELKSQAEKRNTLILQKAGTPDARGLVDDYQGIIAEIDATQRALQSEEAEQEREKARRNSAEYKKAAADAAKLEKECNALAKDIYSDMAALLAKVENFHALAMQFRELNSHHRLGLLDIAQREAAKPGLYRLQEPLQRLIKDIEQARGIRVK